ncbi:DNA primase [Helicobacter pametensis]|uniref:DNA primase n=1 Tax=Helicobacter pametensis TaxID=95149 RepID=UPI000484AC8F|nr:DNA primase [Helicobacter pametensis]
MITKESIEQLKARLDIIEILGNYIQLKRAGSNYSACCPFHDEKTPSFMVSPIKGIYHCYGCGASGDTIAFVMEYEKLSFAESVEKIASLVGFSLTYTQERQKQDSKFLDEIAQFYHSKLLQSEEALKYVKSRGISRESIERFNLGLCGAGFESVKFADMHNARSEAIELGVLGQDRDRVYSRFFERLMFPIYSPSGKVVGFGGRAMGENSAKYINSPQSKVFNKSKLLYAYHLAKESIYAQKQIIIAEGYIDVIMMHQAGFKNVVATLGTALTKEHLPLLSKGEPEVIVSYDGDKAGINAAFKAAKLLAGREGGVVIFEGGADPADMVVAGKIEEIKSLLSSPIPFVEFVLEQIVGAYDLKNPLQKEKALKESLEFLHSLSSLLQEEYRAFLSRLLKIPLSLVRTRREKQVSSIARVDHASLTELVLIKSILEHHEFLDFAIEFLEIQSFQRHFEEFALILQEEWNHPALLGIRINEAIVALDFDDFKKQVRDFAIKDYQQKLKKIPFEKNLEYRQKIELITKYKNFIQKIQKGEI